MTQVTNIVIDMRTVSDESQVRANICALGRGVHPAECRGYDFLCIDRDGDVLYRRSYQELVNCRWTDQLTKVSEQELARMANKTRLSNYDGAAKVYVDVTDMTDAQITAAYRKLSSGQGVRQHESLERVLRDARRGHTTLKVDHDLDLYIGTERRGYTKLTFDLSIGELTMASTLKLSDLNEHNIRSTVIDLAGMSAEQVAYVYDRLVAAGGRRFESKARVVRDRTCYPMLCVDPVKDIIGRPAEFDPSRFNYTVVSADVPAGLSTLSRVPHRTVINCTDLTAEQVSKAYEYFRTHGVDEDEDEDDVLRYAVEEASHVFFGADSCGDTMTFCELFEGYTEVLYDLGDAETVATEQAAAPTADLPSVFSVKDSDNFRGPLLIEALELLKALGYRFNNEDRARSAYTDGEHTGIQTEMGKAWYREDKRKHQVTIEELRSRVAGMEAEPVVPTTDNIMLDLSGEDKVQRLRQVAVVFMHPKVTNDDEGYNTVRTFVSGCYPILRLTKVGDEYHVRTFEVGALSAPDYRPFATAEELVDFLDA